MTTEPASHLSGQPTPAAYDAFLSYTHADRPIAIGVQRGLHQIGRRLGSLRALRVFRDDTNLEVSPDLWGGITAAMDHARFLVVVLSPNAAGSYWVNREVQYWLAHRERDHLLLVHAGGRLCWDADERCFDPDTSDAALPVLTEPGVLEGEPPIVDISGDAPWDPKGAAMRDSITALAAPIHGQTEEQLAELDRREQRRLRRLRNGAVAALALLTVTAVVLAGVAVVQNRRAITQRNHAIALRLNADAAAKLVQDEPGGDMRAFYELLAARRIDKPDDGALLDALALRATTAKIVDTGPVADAMAVSPDGRLIATSGADHSVRIWNAITGQPVGNPLRGHTATVSALAFSRDGRRLASGSTDIRLWDTASWRLAGAPLVGLPGTVASLTFSFDGRHIAGGAFGGDIRIWDIATGVSHDVVSVTGKRSTGPVAYSPDGRRLAWLEGNAVHVVGSETGEDVLPPLAVDYPSLLAVAFSPDGHHIAAGSELIQLWNADTGAPETVLGGYTGLVGSIAFSPDGSQIAGTGSDGAIRLWSTAFRTPLSTPLQGHTGVVIQLAFTGGGTRLVSAGVDGTLRIWSLSRILSQGGPLYRGVAFDPVGHRIAGANSDGTVAIWDTDTGRLVHAFPAHQGVALALAFSRDGKRLVSGGADHDVRLWNADTGEPIGAPLHGHGDEVQAVAFSPDGHRAASGSKDGTARLWNADTGEPIGEALTGDVDKINTVAFSPDGNLLLSGGTGRTRAILVWDTHTGAFRDKVDVQDYSIWNIAFRPDGHRFASAGTDGIHIWNTEDLSPVGRPLADPKAMAVAFSPDGHRLVSGGSDRSVRLWDADTGHPVGDPFTGHAEDIYSVAFSPDGRFVASGGVDGTIRLWDAVADPQLLCDKLTHDLTVDQWNQWFTADIPYARLCPGLHVGGPSPPPDAFSVLGVAGLKHPQAITADSTGDLYIADTKNNRVVRVAAASGVATELPFGDIDGPFGVSVDDNGDVFVTAKDNAIYKLPAGATSPARLMVPGMHNIGDIAADGAGTLYIGDGNRVLKLAAGSTNPTPLPLRPDAVVGGLAVDARGDIFASDVHNGEVVEIPSGTTQPLVLPFSELSSPGGLTVNERGDVFVADLGNNRVLEIPSGWPSGTELPFSGLNEPYAVAVTPTGDLYVADAGNNRLVKLPAAAG